MAMAITIPSSGAAKMKTLVLITPDETIAAKPALAVPAPTRPPTSAWLLLDGMPRYQVIDVPQDRPGKGAENHRRVDDRRIDDPLADGLRDMKADEQEGDEVEESRPGDRHLRREDARRDHGRDRIGRVVQAVDEIEREGEAR